MKLWSRIGWKIFVRDIASESINRALYHVCLCYAMPMEHMRWQREEIKQKENSFLMFGNFVIILLGRTMRAIEQLARALVKIKVRVSDIIR